MEAFPPIATMAAAVHSRKVAPDAYAEESLTRLDRFGGRLGAVLDSGRQHLAPQVAALRERLERGERPPLAGVPVALKDNICTRGWKTTCGSRILERYEPPYDATVVQRLRAAGALLVCKTNMDEFAMGSSTENSAFFPARNPWDPARTPGGSSGGSAAVVAAGLAPVGLGSDTGGSIRQPAAFTGTVGLKPTYGRVSRYGLVAFGSSLDQIGPLARNVADAARILQVMAGRDEADATSSEHPVGDYAATLERGVKGLRIGLPSEYLADAIDARISSRIREAAKALEREGATLKTISLPHTPYAIPTYYLVATSEASSNLARHDGIHCGTRAPDAKDLADLYMKNRGRGLGAEVTRRILLGTFALSSGYYDAYYDRAMRVRTLLSRDFEQAFREVDVILSPTTPTPPFRLGEKVDDPLQMYLADILTAAGNLAGVPGLVVPVGFVSEGGRELPVGLQITAPHFAEALLFQVGRAVEKHYEAGAKLPVLEETVA